MFTSSYHPSHLPLLGHSEIRGFVFIASNLSSTEYSWFIVVKLLSHVLLFATPWTAACQTSLSFIIPQSLLKFMSTGDAI